MHQEAYQLIYGQRNVVETVEYAFINGDQFEFWDLLETLRSVRSGGARVANHRMAEALIRIGVLASNGGGDAPAEYNEEPMSNLLARLEEREELLVQK